MTDRDLLANAAKAYFDDSPKHIGEGILDWVRDCKGEWTPLTDDGDALRLAVKLGLRVDVLETDVRVVTPYGAQCIVEVLYHGEDPYVQTRRAIVRAAAEIGKEMP